MKKNTLLAILQQSEYNLKDFIAWYKNHQHENNIEIEPSEWTPKLKLISTVYDLLPFGEAYKRINWATTLVSPIDSAIKMAYCKAAQLKLLRLKKQGLTVVAIAGSYAKTSTKHIASHLLSVEKNVLVTPKSINTPLGIAQVILKDLSDKHDIFVVELGEYFRGDIKALSDFSRPDFGIMTPIGHQHLEKMGSIAEVAKTIGELADYFRSNKDALLIAEENQEFFGDEFSYYGATKKAAWHITNGKVSRSGTEFSIVMPNKEEMATFMPLFGLHQAINSLPSFWISQQLGLPLVEVAKRCASLPIIERRHQPYFAAHDVLILDNSYNTNYESATASLKLLDSIEASERIMVTAGLLELGTETDTFNKKFGHRAAQSIDWLGVIENPAAESLIEGFLAGGGKKNHVVTGKDQTATFEQLRDKIKPKSIVLFEGGFREIYT